MADPVSEDGVVRPDDDDYDLLTVGEAGARVAIELKAERRKLDDLEKQLGYIGESSAVAAQIAQTEARVEQLEATAQRIARPPSDRLREAIARSSAQLEVLEERFAYIAEDSQLAGTIAEMERHIESLRAAERRASQTSGEQLADEIAQGSRQLEVLEERFAYIAEDSDLATRIAELERHLERLKAEAAGAGGATT